MTTERNRRSTDRVPPRELTENEMERIAGGLRIGGIDGESTDDKHKTEIDVIS